MFVFSNGQTIGTLAARVKDLEATNDGGSNEAALKRAMQLLEYAQELQALYVKGARQGAAALSAKEQERLEGLTTSRWRSTTRCFPRTNPMSAAAESCQEMADKAEMDRFWRTARWPSFTRTK